MIRYLPSSVKEAIRPIALPVWLRLQERRIWQRIVHAATTRRAPRPFQAFGVGLPKTGTVSLANLLKPHYAASHEPETWILTHLFQRSTSGAAHPLSLEEQIRVLRTRDRLLHLTLESNYVLGYVIEALHAAFPDARYILTIRDCFSWINSAINQRYAIGYRQPWSLLADYRYGVWPFYAPEENKLKALNLYPIRGYFTYWSRHIKTVRQTIPPDQLLIIRTRDLSHRTQDIADFLSIPHSHLNLERSHSHKRSEKPLDIKELVPPAFLYEQAERYCADLMEEFYDGLPSG